LKYFILPINSFLYNLMRQHFLIIKSTYSIAEYIISFVKYSH